MYDLGKTLRKRYNDFLDDLFLPSAIDAWTTAFKRTQHSVQLVLAGLFPPNGPLLWDNDLKWQPIAYNSLPKKKDMVTLQHSEYQ